MNSFKSIVMSGYYGFDNSGDDAILKAITKDIKSLNSDVEIIVLSNNPRKTEEVYGVKAVNRFSLIEVGEVIRNASLLISGGGSLLQDITSTRSLMYYLWIMWYAKKKDVPVMVYANGIGPIDGRMNRKFTKNVLNKADLITLRDEDSKNFVKELGVENENIIVTADPVFTLEAINRDEVYEIFKKEDIPTDKKFIGISIRKWIDNQELVNIISKTCDYLVDKYDVNIILIPMHYPKDLDISLEVLDLVDNNQTYVLNNNYSVEEIMGVITELELIVAMRLHSLIYAATQEIPMVGISYDPKVDGILKSLGMDYICHVEGLEYEDLTQKIDEVWENREDLREILKVQDKELKEKALSNVKMALDLIGVDY